MKRIKTIAILLALTMVLCCLSGCKPCEHQWEAADCKNPKTCKLCGETTGETTDEHQWEDATTDSPKTCSVCGLTEGDAIEVDERFTTAACKEIFGNWIGKYEQKGLEAGIGDINYVATLTLTFFNNGEVRITTQPEDAVAFKNAYAQRMQEMTYQDFESRGLTQADAEAWSMSNFGKNLAAYCKERASKIVDALKSTEEMVYYVDDGVIYIAEGWELDMMPSSYELSKDTMLLNYSILGLELEMTRTGGKK